MCGLCEKVYFEGFLAHKSRTRFEIDPKPQPIYAEFIYGHFLTSLKIPGLIPFSEIFQPSDSFPEKSAI